jgi:hypothetical protein
MASKMSIESAATRAGWSPEKLSRIESGEARIAPEEIDVIADVYGVGDGDIRAALVELALASAGEPWWLSFGRHIPASYAELIVAESDAARVCTFNPLFIPGLLQTRDYATAITVATTLKDTPLDVSRARVEVRMRRQHEALDAKHAFEFVALLDETVFYRPVGTAATMCDQLDHLAEMVDHPSVTLVVIPREAGPHPGQLGTYMILEYEDARLDDLLFFEAAMGNVTVRDQPDVLVAYRELTDRLVHMGRSGDGARSLIATARLEYA